MAGIGCSVAAALLCALTAVPPASAAPGTPTTGAPGTGASTTPYAFADGDRRIDGAPDTADAPLLRPGRSYRGTLPAHGVLHYRLDLDATDTAYVPVTAVPPAGAAVASTDGIRVSVRDANGAPCSYASGRVGTSLSPRPVTALGTREPGRALCRNAGTYYVGVERAESGRAADASGGGADAPWELEIAPVTEPGLTGAAPTTAPPAPGTATPAPLAGAPRDRAGGSGFATARPLGQGVWRAELTPGTTLFYRMPVDWGRTPHVVAELGGTADGHGYAGGALNLALHNPVRGLVDEVSAGYTGTPKQAALAPLPPVAYGNRYAVPATQNALCFAGNYYLVLHLGRQLADTFGPGPYRVTLRVRLDGRAQDGPRYAGRSAPDGVFAVTAADREAAASGGPVGSDLRMRLLAAGGLGTGTALLVALGGWTLAARRAQRRVSAQNPTA